MSVPSTEKQEEVSKEEWMNRLQNTHVTRADMNKLIMNYLVTGETFEASDCDVSDSLASIYSYYLKYYS